MRDCSVPARRTFRRSPLWLALFALALQFAAAFGHLHPEDYRFLVQGHGPASIAHGGPLLPSEPAMPADSDCPICASIALLGNAPLPALVALPAPRAASIGTPHLGESLRLSLPPHFLFATRGPPLV
ncbi:MAG TPA: hypothetical protein VJR47_05305 [Stellaceae bacterium]|nr:hypothetical protein [Stellaceae bacterium]